MELKKKEFKTFDSFLLAYENLKNNKETQIKVYYKTEHGVSDSVVNYKELLQFNGKVEVISYEILTT